MATSDKEMQTTDCPICHEKYSDPKILPCAHLLCRNCLVSWMKSKKKALCPLCRSDIVDPKHSNIKSLDVFVDSLPTDLAMSAMVESLKIFNEKHVCHVHNNADAISLCLHCNIKLCQGCTEVHRKTPVLSFHKVEDLATLTSERLTASHQAPCSVHPEKTAELVCVDHKVLICQLCATTKHRACSEVTCVSEVSGKYKQSLLEMENKLNEAESSLSQAITELEERLLKSEKSTNAALAEIDTTCDSLLMSVETCRKRLKKLVIEENDKMKAAVHEQKSIISHKRVRVTSHQGLIKRVLQMENGEPLVAMNTWMFHNNCRSNVVLSSNGQTAEVKNSNDFVNRVLISREPMSTNKLYEILLEETDTQFNESCIVIGVCEGNPPSVTLPYSTGVMKTFVGVQVTGGARHGQTNQEYSCPALRTVKVGSRLGVMVDTSHSLHVYVDGKDQGVMAKIVARPCYVMLGIRYVIKVSTLPVSSIQ